MLRAHLLYALAWLSFGAGHSWLAGEAAKARLRALIGRGERLAYNVIALVHIVLVLWVGRATLGALPPFARPVWLQALQGTMVVAGAAVLLAGLRGYDLGRFAGTAQLRGAPDRDEPLSTGGLNAWVRHPLYSGAFLLLWGLAASPLGAATAAWGSLYLLIGSRFEERRLLRQYGAAYAAYRARVPAFIPWKGRASKPSR